MDIVPSFRFPPSNPTHLGNAEEFIGRKIVGIKKIDVIDKVFPESQDSRESLAFSPAPVGMQLFDTGAGDLCTSRHRWALWLGIHVLLALWMSLHGSFTWGLDAAFDDPALASAAALRGRRRGSFRPCLDEMDFGIMR